MKKCLMFLVVLALLVMPCIAGEYQKENIEYERAFASGKYAAAAELAQTGVGPEPTPGELSANGTQSLIIPHRPSPTP